MNIKNISFWCIVTLTFAALTAVNACSKQEVKAESADESSTQPAEVAAPAEVSANTAQHLTPSGTHPATPFSKSKEFSSSEI